MSDALRALRRRIFMPDASQTKLEVRGFHAKDPAARELLETVGESFLTGMSCALGARGPEAAVEGLEQVPSAFRGFAYEGAGMGFAILDGLPGGGNQRVPRFLAGRGGDHVYMVYVGVGWAMARLPRFRWSALVTPDPLLRWLALDGYGFHQAYFHTKRYVHEHYQDTAVRWPAGAPADVVNEVVDQGIGRAMWFVAGADPERVADLIDAFPAHRHADLYSGTGLAATYAGGCDADGLRALWRRSGSHQPLVAQASSFAAEARVRAGLVMPHTGIATQVLCGTTPSRAAQITQDLRPAKPDPTDYRSYQDWRLRVADELVTLRKGAPA
ncbi:MAG: DUF1702 family protein [Frankiaceae bacterium]